MGDATATNGLSRRDLIKRTAAAGAVVWAAPVLDSSVAWGQTPTDCNECDGLTLYSKYAPGNAHVTDNQCLAPCPPVTIISDSILIDNCLIEVGDTVQSGEERADIIFSDAVRLIRTSIKSTDNCYVATCVDNFCGTRVYSPALNVACDTEYNSGSDLAGPFDPPLFQYFYGEELTDDCGSGPDGDPCGCAQEVRRVIYDTEAVDDPLNFIEILLCLKGTTVIPDLCDV